MSGAEKVVKIIDCKEYGTIDIDPSLWVGEHHQWMLNTEIDGKDVLRANFDKSGRLRLTATSFVGVIPINEHVVVRVRPRVPLANLTRMVVDTGHGVLALSAFREYAGRGEAGDWAMDIYTDAFIARFEEASDRGLWREYERNDDEGSVPRGKIDFTRTIQRFAARGVRNKAAYSWHRRTIDTPANRCVKAAVEVLMAHLHKSRDKPRMGDRAKVARLAGFLHSLAEVTEDRAAMYLQDPEVLGFVPLPDSRSYYRNLIDLALLILSGRGIALDLTPSNDIKLESLLIDTNKLFENFVRVSLARYAAANAWPIEVLDGNTEGKVSLYTTVEESALPAPLGVPMRPLAADDAGAAQPDLVFRALDGSVPLVAEAKNTVHGSTARLPERKEVEQAVTYALRFKLPFALLVHPWLSGERGLVYVGRIESVDVYDFRFDLSEGELIDRHIEDMAESFALLAGLRRP
ncbi:hypothetical protein M3666_07190 [Curtobacterium sp. ODYSSEY 48 V2]|uniref:5-methylcytosine restriction system specificity protein McrC n=1 Tax=Curtobacterium sp. ODYSSEY 48 V2 TaxID=2939561 RepID=UPI002041097C|nr:hypothetical protein [Curtobacterium sp. ODYSSEY 48 V2]MCM3504893.1 hypothetical protein [Curtobacterium sp. ODYSSEY 48 V2]